MTESQLRDNICRFGRSLFDRGLSHQPEVLMTLFEMAATNRNAVIKTIKRKAGLEKDELLSVMTARCFEMMRDYSMMLES